MKLLATTLLATAALLQHAVRAEDFDPNKVHLMDFSSTGNLLFRGNMPTVTVNNTRRFAYPEMMALFQKEAGAASAPWPANGAVPYLHILSFNNPLEITDIIYEIEYAAAHPDAVALDFWVLVGNPLSPSLFTTAEQQEFCTNASSGLWSVDQLPPRLTNLSTMMHTAYSTPRAFYIHCEAGCDRTGEFAASYYMQYGSYNSGPLNQTAALARDTVECGRAPEQLSIIAEEWYCLWLQFNGVRNPAPCY